MAKKVKMIEVQAIHDLSYFDHNKEPQYRRQGSKVFELDEDNVKNFERVGAVRRYKSETTPPLAEEVAEEFQDDFADEADVNTASGGAEEVVNTTKPNTLSLNRSNRK